MFGLVGMIQWPTAQLRLVLRDSIPEPTVINIISAKFFGGRLSAPQRIEELISTAAYNVYSLDKAFSGVGGAGFHGAPIGRLKQLSNFSFTLQHSSGSIK